MASTLPLDRMTVEEKVQAMEALWDDLCRRAEGVESPEWHANVLAERHAACEHGEELSEDWNVAKRKIRKMLR